MPNNNSNYTEDRNIGFPIRGKMFYLPSLFHMAPTYDRIVPLAIADLVRAKNVLQVYGVQGLEKHNEGYVMVNNYPVKVVRVAGRLLSYSFKSFDEGRMKSNNNFYLLHVDDCSGDNLMMCVKILESRVSFSLRDLHEGCLMEATGSVHYVQDYEKQLLGLSAKIIGESTDLEIEIGWWSQVLETRKHLQIPWRYVHPSNTSESTKVEKFSGDSHNSAEKRDQVVATCKISKQLQKSRLEHSARSDDGKFPQQVPSVDSFSDDRTKYVEVIDLTLDVDLIRTEATKVCNLPILTSFRQANYSLASANDMKAGSSQQTRSGNDSTSQESVILIN